VGCSGSGSRSGSKLKRHDAMRLQRVNRGDPLLTANRGDPLLTANKNNTQKNSMPGLKNNADARALSELIQIETM
jgi:hypothetical protein